MNGARRPSAQFRTIFSPPKPTLDALHSYPTDLVLRLLMVWESIASFLSLMMTLLLLMLANE